MTILGRYFLHKFSRKELSPSCLATFVFIWLFSIAFLTVVFSINVTRWQTRPSEFITVFHYYQIVRVSLWRINNGFSASPSTFIRSNEGVIKHVPISVISDKGKENNYRSAVKFCFLRLQGKVTGISHIGRYARESTATGDTSLQSTHSSFRRAHKNHRAPLPSLQKNLSRGT